MYSCIYEAMSNPVCLSSTDMCFEGYVFVFVFADTNRECVGGEAGHCAPAPPTSMVVFANMFVFETHQAINISMKSYQYV